MASRHIGLKADVVCEFPCIVANRGNFEAVPELCTVFPVVSEFDAYGFARFDSLVELLNRLWFGLFALQESTIPTKHLLAIVPGHLHERVVDIGQRLVVVSICDGDTRRRIVHRPPVQCELQ
nr:hypothetical protein [Natronomonas gomsonensis]